MGLFSSGARRPDDRSRDYVLDGGHVITDDSYVLLADLVVRFAARPADPTRHVTVEWDPDDERAIHAVITSTIRVTAGTLSAEEATSSREVLVKAVDLALAFAPVAVGFTASTRSVEVRRPSDGDSDRSGDHEFLVVSD